MTSRPKTVAILAANPALTSVLTMVLAGDTRLRVRPFESEAELFAYMRIAPLDLAVVDFDREGRPTTDIDAALEGLVQPIGRHKGIGLAMAMGILSTLLCDAGYGTESGNMVDGPQFGRDGQFYMALDIAAFEDAARFRRRMDGIIREYRASRLAAGVERVLLPGEMEDEIERRNRRDGVPLNETTVANLAEIAARVGADASALA